MMMKVYVIVMSLACIAWADTSYFLTDAVDSIQGREKRAASDLIRIAVLTPEEISGIVDAHNDFRRLQNSSNMRLMSWDSDIAQVAQNWVRNCEFAHSPRNTRVTTDFPNPLGENLYISSTSSSVLSQAGISTVTQAWYDEISDYNYEDNSCNSGAMCGHYTQVVWDDDHKIGCAAAFCDDTSFDHSFLVSCNYGAGGNYVGQHPYDKGPACSECGGSDFCVDGLCGNTNRRDQPPTTTTSTTSTEPSTTSTEPSTTSTEPPTSSTTSTEPSTTSTEPSTSSTTSTEPSTTSTEPPTSSTTSTEPSTSSTEPSTSSTEPSTSSTVLPTVPPTGTPFSTVTPPTGGCASEHLQEWRSEFRRWKEAFNQYLEKYEDPNPDPNNCE